MLVAPKELQVFDLTFQVAFYMFYSLSMWAKIRRKHPEDAEWHKQIEVMMAQMVERHLEKSLNDELNAPADNVSQEELVRVMGGYRQDLISKAKPYMYGIHASDMSIPDNVIAEINSWPEPDAKLVKYWVSLHNIALTSGDAGFISVSTRCMEPYLSTLMESLKNWETEWDVTKSNEELTDWFIQQHPTHAGFYATAKFYWNMRMSRDSSPLKDVRCVTCKHIKKRRDGEKQ
jgi:hypothetical protein